MSFRIKENLGGIIRATTNFNDASSPQETPEIGKVFGVVLNEFTPSKEAFDKAGGWAGIGSIYYLDFEASKNLNISGSNSQTINSSNITSKCKIAKPSNPNIKKYPLVGELVYLKSGVSPSSSNNKSLGQKYYTDVVNLWNNIQHNAPNNNNLGPTFIEKADIRDLLTYLGDVIIQGRKGNGIRFGQTVKLNFNTNEWSSTGNDGDPITILVNGYVTTNTGSYVPNIEEINKEMSSIYMTSTQSLPLKPGAIIRNPIFSSTPPQNYRYSQIILNSDRVTLNSKKDEVLLFAKTNIGLNTDNNIILNAGKNIHLNIEAKNKDSKILLGTKADGTAPEESVLLGDQTHDWLLEMCKTLTRLSAHLCSAVGTTPVGPVDLLAVNSAGEQLSDDVDDLIKRLEKIKSTKVFTA